MNSSKDAGRSLAIIGCGAVVESFYVPALNDLGWNLVFVDSDAGRAQEIASRVQGATAADSIDSVIGNVSHAVIATPPALHYAACRQLLEAGIHVLCEKPFVLDPAEGQTLIDRASGTKLKLHVNQTRRWFPASIAAKRLIAEGAIGELTDISARYGARFNWPARTAFHSQPGLARHGILSDQGSHTFDLIAWILGRGLEPVNVQHDGYAGPETTVRVAFSSGPARGDAVMTWLVDNSRSHIHFVGTRGRITLDEDFNRMLLERDGEVLEVSDTPPYASFQAIATDLLAAFVNGTDRPGVALASDVLPSIAFLDRAYRISEATLPLVTELGRIPR